MRWGFFRWTVVVTLVVALVGGVNAQQPKKPAVKAPAAKKPAAKKPAGAAPKAPAPKTPAAKPPAAVAAAGPPPVAAQLQKGQKRKIARIQFRGNRKVEDDAMLVNMVSSVGAIMEAEKVAVDVRAVWKMGFFDDVRVEAALTKTGAVILTYVLSEKPSVRKILVSGNKGLKLDKINEVLDLRRDEILSISKIKKNVAKVRELYVSEGFYLAGVEYQVRPINEAEVDVWLVVNEQSKVQIRRVSFLGNEKVTDQELRQFMGTSEAGFFSFLSDGGTFKEEIFERDLALITAYYYDKGHVNVKIGTPQVTLSRDRRYMYIEIPIDEGPVFSIGKIDFKGDLLGEKKSRFRKRLQTETGDVFARSSLGRDIVRLTNMYKDRGYAYVNVSPATSIDLEKKTIALTFDIDKGSKVYFERINIRGNRKTRDKVVRRELKISEGELYNQTNLEISRRRVTALGYFEKVDISTRRGSSDEFIVVDVQISERPTGTFQIGAGFSSVENFIAQAQISQNNLFGRGQTLALQAQLSGLRQQIVLRFVEPYFLDTNWTFAFDVFNQSRVFPTFVRSSTGGNLTWGYPLSYEARGFLTYKLEDVGISSGRGLLLQGGVQNTAGQQQVFSLFRGGFTSSIRASAQYDSRDNRLFPRNGFFHNAFVELADNFTGSENVFVRYGGFSRFYKPIYGPFTLKVNAEVGVITSRSTLGVPISERYLVGGINDIRGFRPRTLGPRISVQGGGEQGPLTELTLGGNMQVIFNSEIEFPLFERVGISGVVFFDAGNAYNLESKWCNRTDVGTSEKVDPCFNFPDSLVGGSRKSVGFGFRWFSPIGPLRFEWGIPLDRQPGEESVVFEFTIGNFF